MITRHILRKRIVCQALAARLQPVTPSKVPAKRGTPSAPPASKAAHPRTTARERAPLPICPVLSLRESWQIAQFACSTSLDTSSHPSLSPPPTFLAGTASNWMIHSSSSWTTCSFNRLLRSGGTITKSSSSSLASPHYVTKHLVGDVHVEFPRPIENNGYDWFNVSMAEDFGGFDAYKKDKTITDVCVG